MVKIGRLWGDAGFARLPSLSKLLYVYLCTQPSISTLGVLELDIRRIELDLYIKGYEDVILKHIESLVEAGLIIFIEKKDFYVFIVKDHYRSLARTKATIRKALDEGKNSPYRETLLSIYSKADFMGNDSFKPPTPDEVTEHALENGYVVNGETFVEYYADNDWYNKNNKKVRNWKATLLKVWCREENKLTAVSGAPKGYEYFYIKLNNGDRISPEGWKNGMPTHSNFLYAQALMEKFNEQHTTSN